MALTTRPKPKPGQKKRRAQHHRHSRHYLKAYWPYLPMLMLVGVGLAINSLWSNGSVLGSRLDYSPSVLLEETNLRRGTEHEAPLSLDPQLTTAAQAKANDMVTENYWAHNSPDGDTPWSFITASGYQYQVAGENLAYGFDSAESTIIGWMNSAEHRANILNANYQNVGFGVASTPDFMGHGPQTIIVAEYGQPIDAAAHVTFSVPETAANRPVSEVEGVSQELEAKPVSRIQVITQGQASWSLAAVSALVGGALVFFVVRHGFRLHRLVSRGEAFVSHHPYIDVAVLIIIIAGFILTRSSGIIR